MHAIYYYVPGMLVSGLDMEHIVALTAPRHQLILTGDLDPLSPIAGIHKVMDYRRRGLSASGRAGQSRIGAL